jgi:hypothetical protein
MKFHWLALLLVLGAAIAVPSVSAKIVEEKNGYIVTPGDNSFRLPDISRFSSATISQGQTQWYSTLVSPGKNSFFSDLYWAIRQIPSRSRSQLPMQHSGLTTILPMGKSMAGLT